MSWLYKAEKKFGWLAIPGLIKGIAILQGVVFLIEMTRRGSEGGPVFTPLLALTNDVFQTHEYWRLITWVFIPMGGLITMIFTVLISFFISDAMEEMWGAFRVTLYVLIGFAGILVAALVFDSSLSQVVVYRSGTGRSIPVIGHSAGGLLFASTFLGFCALYPDLVLRLYGIIPIPAKVLGIVDALLLGFLFVVAKNARIAIALGLVNFVIFVLPQLLGGMKRAQRTRAWRNQREEEQEDVFHRCCVCGKTDVSHPELNFFVAADGKEYCEEHLPKA